MAKKSLIVKVGIMKFKFKVWDNIKNTWIVDPKINAKGKYIGQTSEAGRFEVRPYIGLKDRNGNEIYLNDDVKIEGVGIVKVIFQLGAFGYIFPKSNNFVPFAMDIADGSFNINNNSIQEIELIEEAGNE